MSFIDEIAPEPTEPEEEKAEEKVAEPVEEKVEEPEAAPEAAPEAVPEPQTVPLAVLMEEKARAREYRDELKSTQERIVRVEALLDHFKAPSEPEAPIPQYEEDPDGNLRGNMDAMSKRLDQYEERDRQSQEQAKVNGEQNALMARYQDAARTYTEEKPDFMEAYAFMGKSVEDELVARGFDDPMERAEVLLHEEGQLAQRAISAGKNPAQALYELAVHRGYKPNGSPTEEGTLDRLKAGAEASASLAGPGTTAKGTMSIERLLELAETDPAQFDVEFPKAQRTGILG